MKAGVISLSRSGLPIIFATSLVLLASCGTHPHSGDAHHDSGDGHHGEGDGSSGMPGDPADVDRVINVVMHDTMRFEPESIDVKQGETIHFKLSNSGKIKHEMVIGNMQYLMEHSELMKKFPEMEHEEPNMLLLEPGANGDLIWNFTKAGKVDFACLQAGHFDAGMKGVVAVAE